MSLIAIEFLALVVAALWASTAPIDNPWLRIYFLCSLASSFTLFVVSAVGYGIASPEYAAAYAVFRAVIIVAATAYTMTETRPKWYLMGATLIPVEFFLFTVLPIAHYYQWIAAIKGIIFTFLGITLFSMSSGRVNKILGALWFLQAVDAYAFTKFTYWDLNEWEPSAVTVAFYSWIGWQLRWRGHMSKLPGR